MRKKLLVCANYRLNPSNPSCAARGSEQIAAELQLKFKQNNIAVEIEESPCMGFCNIGPNLRLVPNGQFFHSISTKNLPEILQAAKKFTQ